MCYLRLFSFQQVYHGTSHIHKVAKLNESTDYHFRILAINDAGEGPASATYSFRTTKASPPAMKGMLMFISQILNLVQLSLNLPPNMCE
jgi:hypothetical protein